MVFVGPNSRMALYLSLLLITIAIIFVGSYYKALYKLTGPFGSHRFQKPQGRASRAGERRISGFRVDSNQPEVPSTDPDTRQDL